MAFLKGKNISFHTKITLILVVVAIVPLAVFSGITLFQLSHNLRTDYESSSKTTLTNMELQIDQYFKTLEESMFAVLYTNSATSEIDIYNNIQSQLLYIHFLRDEHESLFYYFPAREEFYIINNMGNLSFFNAADVEEQQWYQEAIANHEKCVILPQHYHTDYQERYMVNTSKPVFTVCRTFNLERAQPSVLALNCDFTGLDKIFQQMTFLASEYAVCLTETGQLLYGTSDISQGDIHEIYAQITNTGSPQGTLHMELTDDQVNHTIVYTTSPETGIILFKSVPDTVLNRYVGSNIEIFAVTLCILLIVIIPLGTTTSRWISRPLAVLKSHMHAFGCGQNTSHIPITTTDEFGEIAGAFNQMVTEIEQLIYEQYTLTLSQRNTQYYSLLAQINPHFMNNILQSIGSVALDKDVPEIYTASSTLAQMLRYSISEADMVTLKQELQNASHYLSIQKFRFEDSLNYDFQAEEALQFISLPKMTLQPLIENAVIHGLEPKKTPGHITVGCVRLDNNHLSISITDDGVGMSPEKVEELYQRFATIDQSFSIETAHIGVSNVYHRLRILYGTDFSCRIESQLGNGSCCTLTIPITEENHD